MSIKYYNENSELFFRNTVTVDLSNIYNVFLPYLNSGDHILDVGCGSGRDSKYFLDKGFQVTAFDASELLVKKARRYTEIDIICSTFNSFVSNEIFDAIWACASLLHVQSNELNFTINVLANYLKSNGYFYCSFKYGDNQIVRDERSFTNADEKKLTVYIKNTGLSVQKTWVTEDARPGRKSELWLNAILYKA